jgi:inorganic pyrophosphatase
MARKKKKAYTAPTILKPVGNDDSAVRVVIETPKGCGNKYKFDPKIGGFVLSKVLPEGMAFPYDFGFIPSTESDDGDPVDVILLMDQPAFPGCIVESRLIGVIEGEQEEDGKKERNDRLIAVAAENRTYSNLKTIADMNDVLLKDIGEFFVNYHRLRGTKFRVLGSKGPKQAQRLLRKAIERGKAA